MKVRKDLSGQVFTRLTVLNNYEFRPQEGNPKRNRTFWECKCECGNTGFYRSETLLNGATKSCGCLLRSGLRGNYKHGQRHNRIYYVWSSLIDRCQNPNNSRFTDYMGRGIGVCEEWKDFDQFYKWSLETGYNDSLTIDRINNDLGYSPENCQWTDNKTQANNKRNNKFLTYEGETKTLAQWAEYLGMNYKHFHITLKRGKTLKELLIRYNKL